MRRARTGHRRQHRAASALVAACAATILIGCGAGEQSATSVDRPDPATSVRVEAPPMTVPSPPQPVPVPGAGWEVGIPLDEWPTSDPLEHGLSPARLDDVAAYLDAFGSNCLVVVKDGYLVDSRFWNGTTPTTDQEAFSITKSITGTLIGIAEDRGLLDIDETASTYITEWRGTASEGVTIKNLLSMDSGRHWDAQTDVIELSVVADDKRDLAIGLDQQHPPGEHWAYNSSGVEVLGAVLERATGQTVEEFAKANLFEPIGMTATLTNDRAGNAMTFMGLQADCLDLARFGYLVAHGGAWRSEQLVSSEWIEEATSPSQELMSSYGYLWWLNDNGPRLNRAGEVIDDGTFSWPDAPHDTFSAEGAASQLLIVVPSEDLVVVRLGPTSSSNEPEVVGNEILRRLLTDPAGT